MLSAFELFVYTMNNEEGYRMENFNGKMRAFLMVKHEMI